MKKFISSLIFILSTINFLFCQKDSSLLLKGGVEPSYSYYIYNTNPAQSSNMYGIIFFVHDELLDLRVGVLDDFRKYYWISPSSSLSPSYTKKFSLIRFPISIEYYFLKKKKLSPFSNLGLELDIPIEKEFDINSSTIYYDGFISWILGAGLRWSMSQAFSCKINSSLQPSARPKSSYLQYGIGLSIVYNVYKRKGAKK